VSIDTSKQLAYLFGLIALIFFLWDTQVLLPLKILVVFFHESSHALATILTGGSVEEMVVVAEQGGHVISRGGNRVIVLTAGYLGSLMWGLSIFMTAVGTQWDRWLMGLLGGILGLITLLFVSNTFAFVFGIGIASLMIASAKWLSTNINDIFLRIIGLTSMLYVPLDIYSDTIQRSNLRSDARMLAEVLGGSTLMWGILWLFISLALIAYGFRWSLSLEAGHTPDHH